MNTNNIGYVYAILAALLFGASTPLAKITLNNVDPWMLAGILYFGSGITILLIRSLNTYFSKNTLIASEASLTKSDWPWAAGATLFGGILGPGLLMSGLSLTTASHASLFLNFEGVFTSLLAWFVFKEHFDRRIALGMLFIIFGGITLSWPANSLITLNNIEGPLLISLASLSWAIDNNLTRKISACDPLQITILKSLVAGSCNIIISYFFYHSPLPGISSLAMATIIGAAGYGLSLICFILALRHIGTSRTGAYFSMAPFIGVVLSIIILSDSISLQFLIATALMLVGVGIHLSERHVHSHVHEEIEHDHNHDHLDPHHSHSHSNSSVKAPPEESHSHFHRHQPLAHSHPHYPDIHHRHKH
ncbi:MAG: DMT family transporter [Oligoflexia bacterium]|nr:DMT family transporter [Oligoflexia bacterium]